MACSVLILLTFVRTATLELSPEIPHLSFEIFDSRFSFAQPFNVTFALLVLLLLHSLNFCREVVPLSLELGEGLLLVDSSKNEESDECDEGKEAPGRTFAGVQGTRRGGGGERRDGQQASADARIEGTRPRESTNAVGPRCQRRCAGPAARRIRSLFLFSPMPSVSRRSALRLVPDSLQVVKAALQLLGPIRDPLSGGPRGQPALHLLPVSRVAQIVEAKTSGPSLAMRPLERTRVQTRV